MEILFNIFLFLVFCIFIIVFSIKLLHPDTYNYMKDGFNHWIASIVGDEWR